MTLPMVCAMKPRGELGLAFTCSWNIARQRRTEERSRGERVTVVGQCASTAISSDGLSRNRVQWSAQQEGGQRRRFFSVLRDWLGGLATSFIASRNHARLAWHTPCVQSILFT